VAIITGSTKGIGFSTAKTLVKNGTAVVINGRNEEMVQQKVRELQSIGGRAAGLAGAVERSETGENLVAFAKEQFGFVSYLINNAGIIHDKISYKMSDEEFNDVIDVHVKGTFYCTKPFIRELKQQQNGGHIINMTSDSGLLGNIGQLNYSAAKAAINGMTWTLAKELRRDGIIVNAVAPAALTDMTRLYVEKAKQLAVEKGLPLSKNWEIGTADEVAGFITRLLKKQNIQESGTIFGVNGKHFTRWKPPVQEPLSGI
jgi:3-oxoacyl-[acyl-carrier protein] reductase